MGMMRVDHNVVLAGGQGRMINEIFRFGHLGHVTNEDIGEVMTALREVPPKLGFEKH